MPTVELNDPFCRSAKAAAGAAKTDYFDTTVKGLCLRVSAAGVKTWYLAYSKPNGQRAWLKLGRYPALPLGGDTGARQRARDTRAAVSEGGDPQADKRARAAAQTVRDLVENYISRRAAGKRSRAEIARRLRKNVSGYGADGKRIEDRSAGCIGDVKLADLHRRDLTKAIDAVKDRGAETEAGKVFEDVRAMVRWARGRGDLDSNLCEGMARPNEPKVRERWLTAAEIAVMWPALAECGDMREGTKRIVRLCLLTGQRVGEVAGMTRSELDQDAAIWVLPPERVKNGREHSVPLSTQAVAVIREQLADVDALCARKGRAAPAFVFPAPGARAPILNTGVAQALSRQQREQGGVVTMLGVAPFTAHDLRRTAATHMGEIGVSPFIISHVLNHISETKASITTQVYAKYDYAREKAEAMQLWADRLSGIISGGAKVVPIKRKAK